MVAAIQSYSIAAVQNFVAESIKKVACKIPLFIQRILKENSEQIMKEGFGFIAKKAEILENDVLSLKDAKIRSVYQTLFHACISESAIYKTVDMITKQAPEDLKRKFLPSFVLSEAQELYKKLLVEQSESLSDPRVWAVNPETVKKFEAYNLQD